MMICTSGEREYAGISGIPASGDSQTAEGYAILLIPYRSVTPAREMKTHTV